MVIGGFLLLAGEKGLTNPVIKTHVGALYSGIDLTNPINVHYITLFLVRRGLIGVAIAFARNEYFIQLELFMITSWICLQFLMMMKPYKEALNNFVEVCNECLVICTVYLMHGFSFYVDSREWRFRAGWVYIGIVALVFLINCVAMIKGIVIAASAALKRLKAFLNSRKQTLFEYIAGEVKTWWRNYLKRRAELKAREAKKKASRVEDMLIQEPIPPLSLSVETECKAGKYTKEGSLEIIDEAEEEDMSRLMLGDVSSARKHAQLEICIQNVESGPQSPADRHGSPEEKNKSIEVSSDAIESDRVS